MCGIAGLIAAGPPQELEAACRRMVKAQAHRGPDDEGLAALPTAEPGGQVLFGHCRLAVLDPSPAGHQPMSNEDGSIWVVHNGEIYNFQELREQLASRGYRFRSNTDTEVIVHAYEAYGPACVERFNGMFAFAVWDANAQRLLLARDRVGEKPLYYARDGQRFLFASEVRSLLASGWLGRRLNLAAVKGYLHFGSLPSPLTLIEGIQSLPPGCVLQWESGQVTSRRYWDLQFDEDTTLTESLALEQLRDRLREAVRRRLISDVPLGAFLSGGLDSSSVVALMRQAGVSRLRTFSLSFDHPELNEGPFARVVADHFETEHTEYRLTPEEVLGSVDRVMAAMDQPSIDGFNTYWVSRLTRSSGTVVALSGLGGDELFGGYSTFWHVPRLCRWGRVAGSVPGGRAGLQAAAGLMLRDDRAQKLRAFLRRSPSPEAAYVTAKGQLVDEAATDVLSDEANAGSAFDAWAYVRGIVEGHADHLLNCVSRLELETYLPNQLLRDADTMSMAHALEIRAPLLDHELIEFVARIPPGMKFSGRPKRLLIDAMAGCLPRDIVNRPKVGFGFPFESWMKGPWRSMIETRLHSGSSSAAALFNREGLATLWDRFLSGHARWSRVWAIVVLQSWVDRHLDSWSDTVAAEAPLVAGTRSHKSVEAI